MTLPMDPHLGIDLPDDGWRAPTLRDKLAEAMTDLLAPARAGLNVGTNEEAGGTLQDVADCCTILGVTLAEPRCNPALIRADNPIVIAPCCGRKRTADKLVEVAPGGPLLCDSCRRIAIRDGELTRESIIEAHGGPESAKAIARHVASVRGEV